MKNNQESTDLTAELDPIIGSSNVAAAGYNPETKVLVVEYHTGGRYRWKNILPSVYAELRAAKSAGKFMHALERQYGKGERID